ncbi:MAG: FtsH protease activity modulator HflK [Alphaproteobacteria bacterium]|nr:MAG: FtsH protease activity modulator HflK [Alphaproteobacteria bacterium]
MPWQNNPGGGRNPWGQGPGGGGQQPPNLDDLIRKGQEQLKGAFPGGFGGKGLVIIIALVLLGWLATGLYRVDQNEQGVVLRFGKWVETTGPGLHYHLPVPIESVLTPKVTVVNRVDIGFAGDGPARRGQRLSDFNRERSMLTGDENIAELEYSVFWQIKDAGKFLFNIQYQELTIKAVAESVMREIIGQTPLQSALTEGRAEIEQKALEKIQTVLDSYDSGVYIREVKLSEVDPPASVVDAFRDVQAAQADKERLQNEAEAYQNDIIPRARGEAAKMLQEAEAYREQVIARADGEASRFLAVYEAYKQAKDVTRQRIYLETMEQILKGMSKIIVDDKAGTGVVPYLPLPEVQKRRGE